MPVKVIKAPAGLGKTTTVLELLDDARYGFMEIYVPTHELAQELEAKLRLRPMRPASRIVLGREREGPTGDRMCLKHEHARVIAKYGHPVFPVLCLGANALDDPDRPRRACEHFQRCEYLAQFEGSENLHIY